MNRNNVRVSADHAPSRPPRAQTRVSVRLVALSADQPWAPANNTINTQSRMQQREKCYLHVNSAQTSLPLPHRVTETAVGVGCHRLLLLRLLLRRGGRLSRHSLHRHDQLITRQTQEQKYLHLPVRSRSPEWQLAVACLFLFAALCVCLLLSLGRAVGSPPALLRQYTRTDIMHVTPVMPNACCCSRSCGCAGQLPAADLSPAALASPPTSHTTHRHKPQYMH